MPKREYKIAFETFHEEWSFLNIALKMISLYAVLLACFKKTSFAGYSVTRGYRVTRLTNNSK